MRIECDLFINDTFVCTVQIDGFMVPPQSYLTIGPQFFTVPYDQLPLSLVEEVFEPFVNSFKESSDMVVLKLQIRGFAYVSSLLYSEKRYFEMESWYG